MDEAQFSSIESTPDVPLTGSNVGDNALDLSNPDSILSGTQRGAQNLGSPNLKIDSANNRIIVNDNTTDRVSFGHIGTGVNDWGLKVSQSGVNVTTATNNQLIFNSSQDMFKIVKVLTGTFPVVTVSSSAGSSSYNIAFTDIAHGLNFTPAVIGYVNNNNIYNPIPTQNLLAGGAGGFSIINNGMEAGSVNVSLYAEALAFGGSIATSASGLTAKIFCLQETAS